jgi:hypothetical protein
MKEWEIFFRDNEDNYITTHYSVCEYKFTVEEMYQAFKERLLYELDNLQESNDTK